MKNVFYHLYHWSDSPDRVYGRPQWGTTFGPAEWSDKAVGVEIGRLSGHIGTPVVDLTIVLTSRKVGDFVWSWYGDCIVTEATLSLFRDEGFTGFVARPVTVEKIKRVSRKLREQLAIPPLWELRITGKGGDAAPESGIRVRHIDEKTGGRSYTSYRNGIIVDEANWDGYDFFTINGYPKYILVTERVKELVIARHLTNCTLIPSHKLKWESGERPEDFEERCRAMAARDLDSLLADLEDTDREKWLRTIFALGRKGDPHAVDPLIRKFSDPDPIIWTSAADAVASIARKKGTPEEIRQEIFSKLSRLLGHENPVVRKSACVAFLRIGGEQAALELLRAFEDPDDRVRDSAVFGIWRLYHKPALAALKRLTRDRSKDVRETARRAVREFESGLY
ncbi:MAG: HEAT repeat domain-containing protein [Thermodesulfobacteriota bacterium]